MLAIRLRLHRGAILVALAFVSSAAASPPAVAQTTLRVSVDSRGFEANSRQVTLGIGEDARHVAFRTWATNLAGPGVDSSNQVMLHDRQTGETSLVSVNALGVPSDSSSYTYGLLSSVAANGRFIAFESDATNLDPADLNLFQDIYLRDRVAGTTARLSLDRTASDPNGPSYDPVLTPDGRFVLFESFAWDLVVGDSEGFPDTFVLDRTSGTTERVNVSSSGAEALYFYNGYHLPPMTSGHDISDDGTRIVFGSRAYNLVPNDSILSSDVFLHDRISGSTTLVNASLSGSPSAGGAKYPSISGDGRFVAFDGGDADLVAADTNGFTDIFVCDLQTGTFRLVSVASSGGPANGSSFRSSISRNGRWIAFQSEATNLVVGDTNGRFDIFLTDLVAGTTERVNVGPGGAQAMAGWSFFPRPSADGSCVAFLGDSSFDLGDNNGTTDAFVHDRRIAGAPWSTFCKPTLDSVGCKPWISSSGTPTLSGLSTFRVIAFDAQNRREGIFFWSLLPNATPFGNGTLCAKPPLVRTPVQDGGGSPPPVRDCSGTYSFPFDLAYMQSRGLTGGTAIYGQYWYSDPGAPPPHAMALSRAIQFVVGP